MGTQRQRDVSFGVSTKTKTYVRKGLARSVGRSEARNKEVEMRYASRIFVEAWQWLGQDKMQDEPAWIREAQRKWSGIGGISLETPDGDVLLFHSEFGRLRVFVGDYMVLKNGRITYMTQNCFESEYMAGSALDEAQELLERIRRHEEAECEKCDMLSRLCSQCERTLVIDMIETWTEKWDKEWLPK